MPTPDIGLIGLAVMGQNLVLNMADHGFKVAVYNRTTEVMEKFVAENPDTPEPTKWMPLAARSFSRRMVSFHCELPPSMITSSRSSSGTS